MNNKVQLHRKNTNTTNFDIGLFYLQDKHEFVTWEIDNETGHTRHGHYFDDFENAFEDYKKR